MAIASRVSFNASQYTAGTGTYSVSTTTGTGPLVGDTIIACAVTDAAGIVPTVSGGGSGSWTLIDNDTTGPSMAVYVNQVTTAGAQVITATKPAGTQSGLFLVGYIIGGSNQTPDQILFNPSGTAKTTITAPSVTPTSSTSWSFSVFADRSGGGAITGSSIAPAVTGSVVAPAANNADAAIARWTLSSTAATGTRTAPSAASAINNAMSLTIAPAGTPQGPTVVTTTDSASFIDDSGAYPLGMSPVADSSTLSETSGVGLSAIDSATLNETSSVYQNVFPSTSDSASVTDSSTSSSTASTTDSGIVTDSSSLLVTHSRADSATTTDSSALLGKPNTTDSATFTDASLPINTSTQISGVDSATLSEASSVSVTVSTTDVASFSDGDVGSDTFSTTDSATFTETSSLSSSVAVADSATTTDVSSPINSSTQIVGSETFGFTESTSIVVTLNATDTAGFTDGDIRDEFLSRTDSGTVSDNSTVLATVATTDSSTTSDVSSPIDSSTQAVGTENLSLTESTSISATLSTNDSSVLSDGDLDSVTWSRTDAAALTDSSKLSHNLTDSATTTDKSSIGQSSSETFAFTDSAQLSVKVTDSASLSETRQNAQFRTDAATVTESARVAINIDVSDSLALDDGPVPSVSRPVASPDGDTFNFIEQAIATELPRYTEDRINYKTYQVPNKKFRVIAQDHFTREFIHWDLPLDNVTITYTLSGPNLFSGTLSSEMESIRTLDPPLMPDRTWLHIEEDGVIRGSFLLTPFVDEPQTQTRQIEGEGFSVYPHWIVYEGESYVGIQVDPADMIRKIWDHVQSYPDGYLGVQVSQTHTDVKLGEPPENVSFTTNEGINVNFTAGPYTLNYWSVTNCGDEIDKLCKETPIDYVEYSYWNDNKSDVIHKILLGYPRIGTKRTDLTFREGENLAQLIPSYQGSNDNYASDVIVIGAGTGPGSVRAVTSGRIGLLRKTNVIQDQNITNIARAKAIANFEFKRIAHSRFLIENITVDLTHANAVWGSFAPGDDILVQGTVDYIGYIQDWYRITSYSYDPYQKVGTLFLSPSDSFTYGAETTDPYNELPTAGFATLASQQDFSQLFSTTTQTNTSDQLQAYVVQTMQQQLCGLFNKNGLSNGMCYYYNLTGVETPVGMPGSSWALGPLEDLANLKNKMVMGKTDQGHLLTGENILLLATDGTIGQLPNATSQIVYPNPYYIPQSSDTTTQPTGLQEAAQAILDRMQARLPLYQDWSWDGEPFIVSQYNDTLFEKFLGYKQLTAEMFLSYVIYGVIQ